MILDALLPPVGFLAIPEIASAAEKLSFGTLWSSETVHDPFLPGALVAEHTQRLGFGTAITVSFARSPATLAYTAWDLAQALPGRFILGLGTQVKAHIERRFGMPWPESVVGQLREQILSIRALWNSWQTGERLRFVGDYYKLTLMTPFFNPGPIQNPDIPIYIAGVNTGLARLAGELSDGFLVHPFHSLQYIQDVLRPAIQQGAENAQRSIDQVKIAVTAFVVTSPEEREFVRAQVAFYASTPSYRRVMELHGWQSVAVELSSLASRGEWGMMPGLVDDGMLATFAVVETPECLAQRLKERYHGIADRISLYLPFTPGDRDDFWSQLLLQFNAANPG